VSEENKEIVRRFYEEVENQGNLGLIDELIDPSFRDVFNSSALGPAQGQEGIRRLVTHLRQRPGFHIAIEDLIAEGDKVVMCMPRGAEVLRLRNGKIVERWVYIDRSPPPQPSS
jgi:predicted SnoaL-like aldol condensation-catalyzing enzyme